ncbi:rRNA adenine N-6-methyltransferase family protein [Streptomyces sp. B1866]|uniref:methyltransferase domain-containing protein n=1 Tax=Streptomyces sp. B1866 TaxID=3075431 RepID=UPI00288F5E9C|nr:methyltransferase domain-containing protein [Streptomyces sp. B1866]MDT3395418.1 rRNA adenine N-6-methyltransferase family protein [Streptomyces sp. B1866]
MTAVPDGWRGAFTTAPRSRFTPGRIHDGTRWIDRHAEPDRWQDLVDSDTPLTVQLDDGRDGPDGTPTSSNSMPAVVAAMLDQLDVADGHRVLEIGTGTGWTAGLLAARLGGRQVTTIEIDPRLAAAAQARLAGLGLRPRVVTGDGMLGDPDGAPYDRVHATAAVRRVPRAWIEQTAPGGVIVVPFGTPYCNGALLRLVVAEDGKSASGRFVGDAAFMWVRSQRPDARPAPAGEVRRSASAISPEAAQESHAVAFAIGLRLPGVFTRQVWAEADPWGTGRSEVWDAAGSFAWCRYADWDAPHAVGQAGPRSLWEEVTAARRWWEERGRPGVTRLGLTVGVDGEHRAWLDEPEDCWPV